MQGCRIYRQHISSLSVISVQAVFTGGVSGCCVVRKVLRESEREAAVSGCLVPGCVCAVCRATASELTDWARRDNAPFSSSTPQPSFVKSTRGKY